MIVSPSFLSCDFTNLKSEIRSVDRAKWLHFDVMDGKFVANTTYGPSTMKEIKTYSNQYFDCHLMVVNPLEQAPLFAAAGADLITFHFEAVDDVRVAIHQIQKLGKKVGISTRPNTDWTLLSPYLDVLDLVLVMSVEPGAGGQAFLPSALDEIRWLDQERRQRHLHFLIEVDGGINDTTIESVKEAGADIAVVGSYLFKRDHRNDLIEAMENVT